MPLIENERVQKMHQCPALKNNPLIPGQIWPVDNSLHYLY